MAETTVAEVLAGLARSRTPKPRAANENTMTIKV
jgi:hypothetical protein